MPIAFSATHSLAQFIGQIFSVRFIGSLSCCCFSSIPQLQLKNFRTFTKKIKYSGQSSNMNSSDDRWSRFSLYSPAKCLRFIYKDVKEKSKKIWYIPSVQSKTDMRYYAHWMLSLTNQHSQTHTHTHTLSVQSETQRERR